MKNVVHLLLLIMTPAVLCAETAIKPAFATTGRALYLHGDVSADGDVPSGEKPAFHQMLLDDTGPRGMSAFRTAIEAVGFEIHQAYDADVALTDEFLAPWNVLILGSNQRRFSEDEATAVHRWVSAGGGLVAWSDSAFGGHYAEVGLDNTAGRDSDNDLTKQFGMVFLTDNGGGNYLITDYEEAHSLNAQNPKGGVHYRGEGVSPVRIAPPARMLAKLQEGGLGGKIMVNKIDAPFDPQTDAALAIAHVGKGRVVGTFDRNTFWNAGEGTRLSHENNLEFAQRLILWAAGREDIDPKPIEQTSTPDVAWRVISGPTASAEFENHNAAALDTRITFSQPGIYVLSLEASAGGRTSRGEVVITVE